MITFYWDNKKQVNHWLPGVVGGQIAPDNNRDAWPERPRGHLWDMLLQEAVHKVTKQYDHPGVWFVNLYGYLHEIAGRSLFRDPMGIEEETFSQEHCDTLIRALPEHVIYGIRERKLIVVVDNSAEGKDLTYTEVYYLQTAMKNAGLPRGSVVFCSGACNMDKTYHDMCKILTDLTYWEIGKPMVDFLHFPCFENPADGMPSDDKTPNPIIKAMNNPDSKDFMSLNQTIKRHRMEHLYWLISEDFVDRGLINGSWTREGILQWDDYINQADKLTTYLHECKNNLLLERTMKVLPLHADYDCTLQHCDNLPHGYGQFNRSMYENSLLSFVTESEFSKNQNSIFLTEKTYKTMIGGHPLILLGTHGSMAWLEAQGYKMQFCDIDMSYDSVTDHVDRFTAAHEELRKWLNRPRHEKIDLLNRDMHILDHNRNKAIQETQMIDENSVIHNKPHIRDTLMWKVFNNIEQFLSAKLAVMETQYTPSRFSEMCEFTIEQDNLLRKVIDQEVAMAVELEQSRSSIAWREVYDGIQLAETVSRDDIETLPGEENLLPSLESMDGNIDEK